MLLQRAFAGFNRLFPTEEAHAHCDIPCGIYDPHAAQIGAHTVIRMNQLIEALEAPGGGGPTPPSKADRDVYLNSLARYITVKEEHAEIVKKEVRIIWGDYFKPEHLEKYPDLHDTYWKAAKLCSKNKQEVNLEAAKELVAGVDKIAEIFWATKGVTWKDTVAEARFGT